MLEIAQAGPDDVVYDLGCGDARILITAVKEFGVKKAVGYEANKVFYEMALSQVEYHNLKHRIKLIQDDLFNADLSEATIITLYLTSYTIGQLKPKLEKEVRVGARIVSHDFEIVGWRSLRRESFYGDTIYLYLAPNAFTST